MSCIDDIKNRVRIEDLLGIGHGSRPTVIKCPLPGHDDKKPSCTVYHASNSFHCFACDVGGDVFTLLMERDRKNFPEALEELAEKAGVSLDKNRSADAQAAREKEQRIRRAIRYAAEYYHGKIFDAKGVIALLEARCITLECIRSLKLGVADGSLAEHLRAGGAPEGLSLSDFMDAGLIAQSSHQAGEVRDYLRDRITFPLLVHGEVVNISGRAITSDMAPKYLHLPGRAMGHFYNEDAIGDKVWLFEGHPDTVIGLRAGLPAVGVIGTGGMTHPERLRYCREIYICGDADRAGQNAVDKWAAEILKHNPGVVLKFVTLSGGAKDFNEWYIRHQGDIASSFAELEAGAKDFIAFKISKIQNTEDLQTVWPLLDSRPIATHDGYFNVLKRQLQNAAGIKTLRQDFKNWSETNKARQTSGSAVVEIAFQTGGHEARANVDFKFAGHQSIGNVCLFADVKEKNEEGEVKSVRREPVIVRSVIPSDGGHYQAEAVRALDASGYAPSSVPMRSMADNRWGDDSVKAFLAHKAANENTAALVRDVSGFFREYIWHREPVTHEILALYAIGTYAARIFKVYPYLAFNGLAGSGKTNCLELMSQLCFNACFVTNISPAALYRSIECSFPTCIRDEAEQFNKKTPENADELTMLNAGYKEGSKAVRVEKRANGQMEPQEFDLYSPKIFAGINMLNDTLMTRGILIKMFKAPKNIVQGMPRMLQCRAKWEAEGAALRDRIYTWVMTKFPLVAEAFDDYTPMDAIANRDWELWLPLLSIAKLADLEDDTRPDGRELLTTRIVRAAIQKEDERKQFSQENNIERKALETILTLIEECGILQIAFHDDWYAMRQVSKALSERLVADGFFRDGKEINPRWLMRILEQTQVLTDVRVQKKQIKEAGEKVDCVLITKNALQEALFNL